VTKIGGVHLKNEKKMESPPKKEGVIHKNENESIEITDKIPKGVNAKAL